MEKIEQANRYTNHRTEKKSGYLFTKSIGSEGLWVGRQREGKLRARLLF
jgi:hypothetical protein